MGTKFTVFDNALHPDRALPDMSNARQELAAIIYVRKHSQMDFKSVSQCNLVIFHHGDVILGNQCFGHERSEENDYHYSWHE